MSEVSVTIPASPFLRQRMGGLTGIARAIILADLAGAGHIHVIGAVAERDWEQSFHVRRRPLPAISIHADGAQTPPRTVLLPGDVLPSAQGLAAMLVAPEHALAAQDRHAIPAMPPRSATMALLRATMKPTEGPVGRWINRPISFRLSALAMRWRIGPDPVTWFTLALAVVMSVVLAHGGTIWLAIGGVLYQAVSVIDCVDGDIARVTWRMSRRGALLDTACDMVANLGFVVGLMTGVIRTYGAHYAGLALASVALLLIGIALMTALLRLGPRRGSFDVLRAALAIRLDRKPRLQTVTLTLERLFKRDVYVLVACVACLAGLAWTLPYLLLGGLLIWLLAIAWCAPLIAGDRAGNLLPPHMRQI